MQTRRNLLSTKQATGLALIAVALGLVAFNMFAPVSAAALRMALADFLAPAVDFAALPAKAAGQAQAAWRDRARLQDENERLRRDLAVLKGWAQTAQRLEVENRRLKGLLQYRNPAELSFLSARVIAKSGGGFGDSMLVTAGARDGVEKDMVVLDENGVAGRVIEVGGWTARILTLRDFDFRLPVTVEEAGQRGILSGTGGKAPRLKHVAQEGAIKPGMHVITSGQGGIFPAGLPVGLVKDVEPEGITLAPHARPDRMEIVRIVRYKLDVPKQDPAAAPVPPSPDAP